MRARTRTLIAFVFGAVVGAALVPVAPWQVAVVVGWSVAAITIVGSLIVRLFPLDATQTAAHATREDDSRTLADLLILGAATASLAAIGLTLVEASKAHGIGKAGIIAAAVLAVSSAWAVVQTVFALRYAHLYFTDRAGIDFGTEVAPDYRDFAYVAITIGMTYQVSDTDITTKRMRRTVTRHAVLSYVYGTFIVAMAINVVASLLR